MRPMVPDFPSPRREVCAAESKHSSAAGYPKDVAQRDHFWNGRQQGSWTKIHRFHWWLFGLDRTNIGDQYCACWWCVSINFGLIQGNKLINFGLIPASVLHVRPLGTLCFTGAGVKPALLKAWVTSSMEIYGDSPYGKHGTWDDPHPKRNIWRSNSWFPLVSIGVSIGFHWLPSGYLLHSHSIDGP